jgi:hypothetical protein
MARFTVLVYTEPATKGYVEILDYRDGDEQVRWGTHRNMAIEQHPSRQQCEEIWGNRGLKIMGKDPVSFHTP